MARVTFICNLCYLIFVVGRYVNLVGLHPSIVATIVVLGFSAFFLNIIVNVLWLVSVIRRKTGFPIWLGIFNFLFLIFQIVNILFIQL